MFERRSHRLFVRSIIPLENLACGIESSGGLLAVALGGFWSIDDIMGEAKAQHPPFCRGMLFVVVSDYLSFARQRYGGGRGNSTDANDDGETIDNAESPVFDNENPS
jgi:hypothetical protein